MKKAPKMLWMRVELLSFRSNWRQINGITLTNISAVTKKERWPTSLSINTSASKSSKMLRRLTGGMQCSLQVMTQHRWGFSTHGDLIGQMEDFSKSKTIQSWSPRISTFSGISQIFLKTKTIPSSRTKLKFWTEKWSLWSLLLTRRKSNAQNAICTQKSQIMTARFLKPHAPDVTARSSPIPSAGISLPCFTKKIEMYEMTMTSGQWVRDKKLFELKS